MNNQGLKKFLEEALSANEQLREYFDYPPVCNSKDMLKEIFLHLDDKDYLFMNKDQLNIGILAAKSLDSERDYDRRLYDYATRLHEIWESILNLIKLPFKKPKSGAKKLVYDFYDNNGYDRSRIRNHMACIDFNFPVGISTLRNSVIVGQWRILSIHQGDYYADINNSIKPDCLGINDFQQDKNTGKVSKRIECHYELQNDVDVLKSVAAAVLDTWSVKGRTKQTCGGCTQYFNSMKKYEFSLIYP